MEDRFLTRSLRAGLFRRRYRVYVPEGAGRTRPSAVILFLHGSGERGRDGLRPSTVGLGEAIRRHPDRFPAIVVFPQARPSERWTGAAAGYALEMLDRSIEEFGGDEDRVYAVGLSMGGYGVLRLAGEHPARFAAVVSVCGGVVPPGAREAREAVFGGARDPYHAAAERIRGVPLRLYHGAEDTAVPCEESRRLAAALRSRGANVLYTEYADVGHDSWTSAFADPGLWDWLFAQRRSKPD